MPAQPPVARAADRSLALTQARCLQLHAQGLLQPPRRRASAVDLLAAVKRMRLLQIDSIHVVARSPYLVLHARLGDYPPEWLEQALAQGALAECWAHEACFVPSDDYALHDAWRHQRGHHWSHRHATRMYMEHRAEMDDLLAHIAREGPVRATDFAREDRGVGGWWEWKPEKRWLEAWFTLGELMVVRRERFQRVYDLSARVRASWPARLHGERPAVETLRERFILDTVRALGIVPARWIADYYRLKPQVSDLELEPLVDSGQLLAVAVRGWSVPAYVHADHAPALAQARAGRLRATHTALLSPFDPLVWDRQRALGMFGFDYALECYTPAPRRRYGYFVLPILHRGALVGRLDAKAHRADGVFEVKALYLEQGVEPGERLLGELAQALKKLAHWHGTPAVRVARARPVGLAGALRAALKSC
ncbi:winged helix-turn-helix domain-containing protein [Dyella sp. KRB-257]|uniref:winged helix-turn-helix domain-containing protein n=1 Tax=Dyella sp. KRB-257 TaxID=3400915 RepID=UPI003BFD706C